MLTKTQIINSLEQLPENLTIDQLVDHLIFVENESDEKIFEPMSQEELNKRINQSESDFRNNRFKNSTELLAKYK